MKYLAVFLLLSLAACGPKLVDIHTVAKSTRYVIVSQDNENFLIYATDTQSAREAAYDRLDCGERPCIIGTGGILMTVTRPLED